MSDTPEAGPAPPGRGSSSPGGLRARWDGLSPARRAMLVAIVLILGVVVIAQSGGDDEEATPAVSPTTRPEVATAPSASVTATSPPAGVTPTSPSAGVTATSAPVTPAPSGGEVQPAGDSRLACERFRALANALPEGDVMRNGLQEVNDAAVTATPDVQAAARAMLDAVTRDDGDGFLGAGGELAAACRAAGY